MSSFDSTSVALFSLIFFLASLAYVLRPLAAAQSGLTRRHHSILLSIGRGLLNGSVVTVGLLQIGYPLTASYAEGAAAGFFSGFFQLTVMNERFSAYLNRARSEPHRVLKWMWFQAIYYGIVKATGALFGGGPGDAAGLFVAWAFTIVFGAAQYPWEAAIAANREVRAARGHSRQSICALADVQTVLVSVTCVGVSILNSVGMPGSRLFLVAVGMVGLGYYRLVLARSGQAAGAVAAVAILLLAMPARAYQDEAQDVMASDGSTSRPAGPQWRRDQPLATPANPILFDEGQPLPRGHLELPSARSTLKVAGFLKLDAIHDTGPYTGDASDLPNLTLRGQDRELERRGITRLHARESRLSLGTLTATPAGKVATFLEVDFFGAAGSNSYGLRMRHAYLSWRYLLAGHTFSTFLDLEARGTTIEFNGPTAAGNRKRAQVRLTYPLASRLTLSVAAENGAADYTDPKGRRILSADTLLSLDGDSHAAQQIPDLTWFLRYQPDWGHLGLRGMGRQLRVAGPDPLDSHYTVYGYGLGASGRWAPLGRSNVFAQLSGGWGLGGFVDDLDGQAATFDASGRRFAAQFGYAGLAGYEHCFDEHWRSNVIASVSGVRLDGRAPQGEGISPLSSRFLQTFVNLIYTPVPDLLLGLEYGYYRREIAGPLHGLSHRVQLGILFRFGG